MSTNYLTYIPYPTDYPKYSQPINYTRFIGSVLGIILILSGSWAIVELILGLFALIFFGKEMDKRVRAKKRIKKAIIVFLIVVVTWGALTIIAHFLFTTYVVLH